MEAPQLDLTSELLGVYGGEREEGTSESGDNGSEEKYDPRQRGNPYVSNPRKVKAGPGQHQKPFTKRTRVPVAWTQIKTFTDEAEAHAFAQSFEGYNWRKGCNNKTGLGTKCYYICKEHSNCKVMSHLHFDNKTDQIIMNQSDRQHCHENTSPANGALTNGMINAGNGVGANSSNNLATESTSSSTAPVAKTSQAQKLNSRAVGPNCPNIPQLATVKKPGGRRRGLNDETIDIINKLFEMDPHVKPSQVQEELKRNNIPLLQNYHINNFLAKLRKQLRESGGAMGMAGSSQHASRSFARSRQQAAHYNNEYGNDNGSMMNGNAAYYSDGDNDNNSSTTDTWLNNPNPMSMVDINLTDPFCNDTDHGEDEDTDMEDSLMGGDELFDAAGHSITDEHRDTLIGGCDMEVTVSTGRANSLSRQNSNSYSPPLSGAARRFSTNSILSGVLPTSTTLGNGLRNNQSEVVSTSNISRARKRNFQYFRDESTKEGDNISPNEDNIKGLIVQHIQNNYSNRDMLHIREELRTLKDMKKFRALNRLLSFTAGFLQDSFLDTTANMSNGNETTPLALIQ